MNIYEFFFLFIILMKIISIKEAIKGENLSTIIKSDSNSELTYIGIILYSLYNSLKICFLNKYIKCNDDNNKDNKCSSIYKENLFCYIFRLYTFINDNFTFKMLGFFNYMICCCYLDKNICC